MTALIYKAALPTYTSLAELNANAGESLLLNDAGTAYELEPAQSGASVRVDRARYSTTPEQAIDPDDGTKLAWEPTPSWSEGDLQLDFTDPTVPTVIEAGIYAVTAYIGAGLAAGKVAHAELDLDAAGNDPYIFVSFAMDAIGTDVGCEAPPIAITQYIPAGGQIYVQVDHNNVAPVEFSARLLIQRIA